MGNDKQLSPKGDHHLTYPIHGTGLSSLFEGFDHIGMPEHRRNEAASIVAEVMAANNAVVLRWYKTDGLNELCCYWDDAEVNMMWVAPSEVHIAATTPRPPRPITWTKADGSFVGWLLPGAHAGSGGGPTKKSTPATVKCPKSNLSVTVGTLCPYCDVEHS